MAGAGHPESIIADYHKSLEDFAELQEKVLQHILKKDAECQYLRRHGFKGQTDLKSFKELLPVIDYDAIVQDMKRILEGDTSPILTCEELNMLVISSGTSSGKRKIFPHTRLRMSTVRKASNYRQAFQCRLPFAALDPWRDTEAISSDGTSEGALGMHFFTAGRKDRAPGGLPMSPSSTFAFTRPEFLRAAATTMSSPVEVILCPDFRQSTYCHLLSGLLRSSQVTEIGALFASGLAFAFNLLKETWGDICRDIETGQLSSLVTDPSARAAVTKLLTPPNPELADLIRAECSKDSWKGVVTRLWPQAKCIHTTTTGSMLQYVDYIKFLTNSQLPLLSAFYLGSEGFYAFNPCLLNPPDETFYVMLHDHQIYFEFLRLRTEQPDDVTQHTKVLSIQEKEDEVEIVSLAGVKPGEKYEPVISNGEGLWRYKIGDVLQCVGFYHQAPKFKVLGRRNVILSIHTDKTEEKELLEAVNQAAEKHLPANARLYDFTSCVSLDSIPGHYVIFWEISQFAAGADPIRLSEQALAEVCHTMEAALSEPYRRGRNIGAIAPLELRVVRPGTFDLIARAAVDAGNPQFKCPRGYKAGNPALAILDAAVTETARSTRLPHQG